MCGIFLCINNKAAVTIDSKTILADVWEPILRRGPEGHSHYCTNPFSDWEFLFAGSVLWMQGEFPILQPLVDKNKNVLLWNGDIFSGLLVPKNGSSDTECLLQYLGNGGTEEDTITKVSHIKGPYALIYWNAATRQLWFGRDRLGRHSLLWCVQEGNLVLTSVGKKGMGLSEVPAVGLFRVNVSNDSLDVVVHPWSDLTEDAVSVIQQESSVTIKIANSNIASPITISQREIQIQPSEEHLAIMNQFAEGTMAEDILKNLSCSGLQTAVHQLILTLRESVRVRCKTQPGLCKLCVIGDVGSDFIGNETYEPVNKNVCTSNVKCTNDMANTSISLVKNMDLNVKVSGCHHPKVGILFSGGLDSSVLAALAHEFVPLNEAIDLLNVAFECQPKPQQCRHERRNKLKTEFCTPDRQTGLQTLEELRATFPSRQWNFVQIDIRKEELDEIRQERISDLIHPLRTVLDDSLGCALWFASRKQGMVINKDGSHMISYISPARVLLLGMGADEQMGGYIRHHKTFYRAGWQALTNELQKDLSCIARRNLGRDDRVVSDHGCQGRYPYLDEAVVTYLSSLPSWARCYPTSAFPPGTGDKLLLRLAAWNLGLHKAAIIPKRAFQFGCRIASRKEKGSDLCSRLNV